MSNPWNKETEQKWRESIRVRVATEAKAHVGNCTRVFSLIGWQGNCARVFADFFPTCEIHTVEVNRDQFKMFGMRPIPNLASVNMNSGQCMSVSEYIRQTDVRDFDLVWLDYTGAPISTRVTEVAEFARTLMSRNSTLAVSFSLQNTENFDINNFRNQLTNLSGRNMSHAFDEVEEKTGNKLRMCYIVFNISELNHVISQSDQSDYGHTPRGNDKRNSRSLENFPFRPLGVTTTCQP